MGFVKARYQGFHIFMSVISSERGSRRRCNVQALHQGLGAMMPRPDGNTGAIKDRGNIMRMRALQQRTPMIGALSGARP